MARNNTQEQVFLGGEDLIPYISTVNPDALRSVTDAMASRQKDYTQGSEAVANALAEQNSIVASPGSKSAYDEYVLSNYNKLKSKIAEDYQGDYGLAYSNLILPSIAQARKVSAAIKQDAEDYQKAQEMKLRLGNQAITKKVFTTDAAGNSIVQEINPWNKAIIDTKGNLIASNDYLDSFMQRNDVDKYLEENYVKAINSAESPISLSSANKDFMKYGQIQGMSKADLLKNKDKIIADEDVEAFINSNPSFQHEYNINVDTKEGRDATKAWMVNNIADKVFARKQYDYLRKPEVRPTDDGQKLPVTSPTGPLNTISKFTQKSKVMDYSGQISNMQRMVDVENNLSNYEAKAKSNSSGSEANLLRIYKLKLSQNDAQIFPDLITKYPDIYAKHFRNEARTDKKNLTTQGRLNFLKEVSAYATRDANEAIPLYAPSSKNSEKFDKELLVASKAGKFKGRLLNEDGHPKSTKYTALTLPPDKESGDLSKSIFIDASGRVLAGNGNKTYELDVNTLPDRMQANVKTMQYFYTENKKYDLNEGEIKFIPRKDNSGKPLQYKGKYYGAVKVAYIDDNGLINYKWSSAVTGNPDNINKKKKLKNSDDILAIGEPTAPSDFFSAEAEGIYQRTTPGYNE